MQITRLTDCRAMQMAGTNKRKFYGGRQTWNISFRMCSRPQGLPPLRSSKPSTVRSVSINGGRVPSGILPLGLHEKRRPLSRSQCRPQQLARSVVLVTQKPTAIVAFLRSRCRGCQIVPALNWVGVHGILWAAIRDSSPWPTLFNFL